MELPPCRPGALYVTDAAPSLEFPQPWEPSADHASCPPGPPVLLVDPATLAAMADALERADVSYM